MTPGATCGACAGLCSAPGPPAARVFSALSLLGTLLGAARRASLTTLLPRAKALPLRLPPPGPLPLPPPPTSAPAKANPRTCQSPILASMDIAARRSRRWIPAGHGLWGSAGPAPWNRLDKSSFFTCSPTSHLVIKSWVATCRRMRASPGIHSASSRPSASQS